MLMSVKTACTFCDSRTAIASRPFDASNIDPMGTSVRSMTRRIIIRIVAESSTIRRLIAWDGAATSLVLSCMVSPRHLQIADDTTIGLYGNLPAGHRQRHGAGTVAADGFSANHHSVPPEHRARRKHVPLAHLHDV